MGPHRLFLAWGLVASGAVVQDGLIVDYAFARSECLGGAFSDGVDADLLGGLARETATTWCLDGLGVGGQSDDSGVHVAAGGGGEALIEALSASAAAGSDGITVELWIRVHTLADGNEEQPIFSIGNPSATSDKCDGNTGLRISEEADELRVDMNYRSSDPYDDGGSPDDYNTCVTCTTSSSILTSMTAPSHLVVTVGRTVEIYKDGALVTSQGFMRPYEYDSMVFADAWSPSFGVELFSDGVLRKEHATQEDVAFDGDVLALRIYDRKLEASEVSANYAAKLPQSAPLARDVAATVNEDGERDAGGQLGSAPEAYGAPLAAELLATVALDAVDADDASDSPNYDGASFAKVYVASLPEGGGALFQTDGAAIEAVPAEVPRDSGGTYGVLARPPLDATGAGVLSFTYYAVDGVTGEATDAATVTLAATPVNDPPIPLGNLTVLAEAGGVATVVLRGSDVDDALDTATASVGAPQSAAATVALVEGRRAFTYSYGGDVDPAAMDSVTGVFYTDAVPFTLTDAHGASSLTTTVTVRVRSPIVAAPEPGQSVDEEGYGSGSVVLKAEDLSDDADLVCFTVLTLPSRAALYDGDILLEANAVLSAAAASPYDAGVPLRAVGEEDFFTTPAAAWNGTALVSTPQSFTYSAFACDASREPKGNRASPPATLSFEIRNVDDAPTLAGPAATFSVYAAGGAAADDDAYASRVTLSGFSIGDADKDVDAVRVVVAAGKATSLLSVDADLARLADFNSAQYCFGQPDRWACEGDGRADGRFGFLAPPNLANRLLATLVFESTAPNSVDVVTVRVYGGAGGDCLSNFVSDSRRPVCRERNATATVRVGAFSTFAGSDSDSSKAGVPWQLALGGIGLLLVLVLVCCFSACRCCRSKQKRRESWRRASDAFGGAFRDSRSGSDARSPAEFEMEKKTEGV